MNCHHCKNQHICKVKEKAEDLLRVANMVMTKGNDKLYAMLTEGIAEGCTWWDEIKD